MSEMDEMMGVCECDGGMKGMMSKSMEGGHEMPHMMHHMIPHMMHHMMPHCLHMMFPGLPNEERAEFTLNMIDILMEHGTAGMTEEDKSEFIAKVLERVTS